MVVPNLGTDLYRTAAGALVDLVDAADDLRVAEGSVAASVRLVEDPDQEEQMAAIANKVKGGLAAGAADLSPDSGMNRDAIRTRNLADLNIMPLNVHALMRELPLANVLNYEYTFDRMVSFMYGLEGTSVAELRRGGLGDSASSAFVRMLVDPMRDVTGAEYGAADANRNIYAPINRIFRGFNGLGLGRPRFLSDQLFNKALFGEIYPFGVMYDEAGPGRMPASNLLGAPNAITLGANNDLQRMGDRAVAGDLGVGGNQLSYINSKVEAEDGKPPGLVFVPIAGAVTKAALAAEGKARFDTAVVREIFHVVNVLRVMRSRLYSELSVFRSVLSRKSNVVDPRTTEFVVAPGQGTDAESVRDQMRVQF